MEQRAFGDCSSVVLTGVSGPTITVTGTPWKMFHIVSLNGDLVISSFTLKNPLTNRPPDNLKTAAIGAATPATSVTLPQGGQLSGLVAATLSTSGTALILFFH
jgi:hypothetical protein